MADDWRCKETTKGGDPCRSPIRSAVNPDYCSRHAPDMDGFWRAASERGGTNNRIGRSTCFLEGCHKKLPPGRTRWCTDAHQRTGQRRAREERENIAAGKIKVASQMRKPPPEFYDEGWHLMVGADGAPSTEVVKDAVRFFDVDHSTVTRWYAYLLQERAEEKRRSGWEPPPRDFPEKWRDLTPADVPALIADFLWFRAEFFETDDEEPYLIGDFHERWIEALMRTWATKGRLMILSPPRHGKSELLMHLVIWLVCRFPNIKVIWVGPNDEIAQDIIGQHVLDQLEQNEALLEAFCPPGKAFKPKGRGRPWLKSQLTVATRTRLHKSPTCKFQGRGATLVSKDADVIICDDIEQDKKVGQPGTREDTRRWASTSLFSRKTARTAIAFIGSRQHPDDLWAHFLENEMFECIVETAHDETCEIPRDDPARYDEHSSCMLWPVMNDFEWLKEMEKINETMGGRETFEMVYLNRAHGSGLNIFDAVEIALCRNKNYTVGKIPSAIPLPGHDPEDVGAVRLIGGLDPSGTGFQAAFLWAYQTQPELRMWMVDLENKEGGGIAQARSTIKDWFEKYELRHWVVEENLYQGGISRDEILMEMRQRLGITLEPHRTHVEKWDQYLGVSTLKPLFAERKIILPYGNVDSVAKSDLYQRQLVYFSNAPRNRNTRAGYKSDLVMASWFPMVVIRRERMEYVAEAGVEYVQSYSGYRGTAWSTAPWTRQRVAS